MAAPLAAAACADDDPHGTSRSHALRVDYDVEIDVAYIFFAPAASPNCAVEQFGCNRQFTPFRGFRWTRLARDSGDHGG
jgi:hypothetical protein